MSSIRIDGKNSDEIKSLHDDLVALNEEARLNFHDAGWRHERAQEMSQEVYEGFQHENIISYLSTVENLPWQAQSFISEVRGLKAFWIGRGGYIEASTLNKDVFDIQREILGFHVTAFEQQLEAGFGETTRTMIDKGIERVDAEINKWFFSAFQAAIDPTSPSYHASAGLSLSVINNALAAVRDASQTREVSIVGRATMTDQFVYSLLGGNGSNGTGFIPETNEALIRNGVLGRYMGANIVTLNNFKDENDVPFLPANELFIVGKDASKTVFWGGIRTKEWVEEVNDYWHFKAQKEVGMMVHRPDRAARIIDTSQNPY